MIRNALELHRLLREEKLSPARLAELQLHRLRKLLQHAWANVPYYRALFESASFHPKDLESLDDLVNVPVTTRNDLMAEPVTRRVARGLEPDALPKGRTSGTTGEALAVYLTWPEIRTRQAVHFRNLLAVGMKPRDRLAVLGSTLNRSPGVHERMGFYRAVNVSPLMSQEEQYRQIRDFDPTVLWFYPSVFQALCEHVERPLGEWLNVHKVISSTELLPESQRQCIRAELGAEIFNCYGAVEFGRIAYECPTHQGLHVNADQLILESLVDGRPARPGESGTVVVTALNAYAAPMIRYELGDIVRYTGKACPCGSAFPLIAAPKGRNQDMLLMPSGRECSPLAAEFWVFNSLVPTHYQIIQRRQDFLEVLLVDPDADPVLLKEKLGRTQEEFLEETMPFTVRVVDHIPNEGLKSRTFLSQIEDEYPGADN